MLRYLMTGFLLLFMAEACATTRQIMVVSDIHFSPFADCHSAKNCPLITQLNKADAGQWPQILAQYSRHTLPANGQPTNDTLFRSLLTQIQEQQPENLLILGDFLAHRYRSLYLQYAHDRNRDHYNSFVLKTMQYLTNSMQKAMPANSSIYPVIGNNDSYGGKDCAYTDYCVIANGGFYRALANQWSELFRNKDNKAQFIASFPHAGYYDIVLPDTRNHIIVLNTVLFSTKVQGPNVDQVAQEQLLWLQKTLQSIADAKEKAWIIFHIPPGIDAYSTVKNFFRMTVPFWNKNYSQQFSSLVHQYNSTITALLSGHTHMDGFLVLDIKNPLHVITDTFVASISPIFGNNSSYKIYAYNTDNFALHNFADYYLNLRDSSVEKWQKEYDFSNIYETHEGLWAGYRKITADMENSFTNAYIRFYDVNTASQPISHGKWAYYWCATYLVTIDSYKSCLKKITANA